MPPEEARRLLTHTRVGLVLLQRNPAYLTSLPTKMFECFAAGLPVLASDFPLWREIVENHDCGQVVDETDPGQIARAVARYANDPALLARHSANAWKAAQAGLNWKTQETALLQLYARLTGSHAGS